MVVMPQVSRPLIALLVASVVFFAVWMVALKPQTGGSSSSSSGSLGSAVAKAHQAVKQSDAASVAHGGTVATTPTSPTTPAATSTLANHAPTTPATPAKAAAAKPSATAAKSNTTAATKHKSAATTHPAAASAARTAAQRQAVVLHALRTHKVVAMLFYNHLAADDRAVKQELSAVPTHGGKVVKLAIPLDELAQYGIVTRQVPVTASPTLIIIDRQHKAWTVVGFASEFEISQRISDALAVKAK